MTDFEKIIDDQETYLDSFIDTGSQQELFIASYIHGHFSVVVAGFLSSLSQMSASSLSDMSVTDLQQDFLSKLNNSINEAINNDELLAEDAIQVQIMLKSLATI